MGRCGTKFKDRQLDAVERETLIDIERLARRLQWQAEQLFYAVEYCKRNETIEGLSEMVAYSFNAQMHTPQYGGGGGGLPAGPNGENVKYKVVILDTKPTDTKDSFGNVKGGYLAFELVSIEGPTKDVRHTDRLNLHHTDPKVVEIANKQLSAYCHVLGKFQFNDTAELHNIPFVVEIGLQKGEEARQKGYTEVKALYDVNGNPPGKAGAGPQANQGQQGGQPEMPPAGGVQPQGGGWGGQNGGGQPDPNQGQQGQGGGQWGGQQNNQQNGQQGGQWGGGQAGAQGGGQPQGGQWGGQGGGQPQGQGGGSPGWGAGQ